MKTWVSGIVVATTALILALVFSGCYHFSALQRQLPGGYDRVAVPIFKNKTFEPGIEALFTSAMIEEMERNHFAKVVSREESQVELLGEITSIVFGRGANMPTDANLDANKTALTKEYRAVVTVNLQLVRRSDGKVLWSGGFNGEKQFPAPQVTTAGLDSVNPIYNHSAQVQNIQILAKDLMAQAHLIMTENF